MLLTLSSYSSLFFLSFKCKDNPPSFCAAWIINILFIKRVWGDGHSWQGTCWACRWARGRTLLLMLLSRLLALASPGWRRSSDGASRVPLGTAGYGTHSWGAGVWAAHVSSVIMAHLKVLDCMINNNWRLICDLYCAWSNQVSLLFSLVL